MELDANGGVIPQDMATAKAADLITLPPSVPGTNCFNCMYALSISGNPSTRYCRHRRIRQIVNERNCCSYWDNPEVKRPWGQQ